MPRADLFCPHPQIVSDVSVKETDKLPLELVKLLERVGNYVTKELSKILSLSVSVKQT